MNQREFIHNYNKKYRDSFNPLLFSRNDEDMVNAIKHVIYSIQRDSTFTIKVVGFEVITNYDDVNHILWEHEDAIMNKKKDKEKKEESSTPTTQKKKSYGKKKKENPYDYINLNESELNVIKVTYFIQITEKKRGLVSDYVTCYIAVPRVVDGFYYMLNGNLYSAMYQIVDASTYNNSASKNSKKQSITFKTVFTPIRVYRYSVTLKDVNGYSIPTNYFVINIFRKSVLLMKYLLAKFGYGGCMDFLKIFGVEVHNSNSVLPKLDTHYVFPIKDFFISVPMDLFNNIQLIQSFVYTIYSIINTNKDVTLQELYDINFYLKVLGSDFTSKNMDTVYDKGASLLESLEFSYDDLSREDLKLDLEDKRDVYCVLRWMMYEFNALRQKDNLDITTKKVRYAEYAASVYASRLATGIYRLSDKGDKAELDDIRKAIVTPPMYLVNSLVKCQLVNYNNCVNDLDALIKLKYTYKGIAGIGEKSNAVSDAYRSIQPSHLGRVDIDTSSNSDPGVSGTICPYARLYDGHFDEYTEPSTWRDDLLKVIDTFKAARSKVEMCRIIDDNSLSKVKKSNGFVKECASVAKSLTYMPGYVLSTEEYIDGFDIFGDGRMFYLRH